MTGPAEKAGSLKGAGGVSSDLSGMNEDRGHPACWASRGLWDGARQRWEEEEATNKEKRWH